jgi:hypothetical protein
VLLWRYALALGLTLAVEAPLYAGALVVWFGLGRRPAIALALAVNLATHPVLWWSLRPWSGEGWYLWLVLGAEVAVCAAEWLLLAVGVALARSRAPRLAADGPRGATVARIGRPDLALLAVVSVGVNAVSVLAGALIAT